MPCYHPLRAFLVSGPQGKGISFSSGTVGQALSLPCGRCIGCRLERARQWAVRIMHEAKMHDENAFLTLTYDSEHLPPRGTLCVPDVQKFLKRLRSRLFPERIRFFLCGEYGEKLGRPHYHAIVFGFSFPDKLPISEAGEFTEYTSELLSETWGLGSARLGSVSFDSACYVANYATKKIVGSKDIVDAHYRGLVPEFLLMSRRPGIGRSWIDKFGPEVFQSDEIIVRGLQARPPRYYDQVHKAVAPESYERVAAVRSEKAGRLESFVLKSGEVVFVSPSCNARRLVVRETVARAKLALKSRRLEES